MNTTEKLAFALLAAANYIDALGGVSAQYRQTLAAYESELAATPASQAPAPAHEVPAGKAQGAAEGDGPDRDEAIRVWHRHCDKFSDALGKVPPSPVIDAMLAFARANVQPKGTEALTDERAHGISASGGEVQG